MKGVSRNLWIIFIFIVPGMLYSQGQGNYTSSEILLRIKKLNVLGSVLYVAAHPDDENTQLISYFSSGELLNTAYFSCTRGDGGQNLIGPEIEDKLGVIRTLELLQARRVDGGTQFFSRAIDFGYSKNPEETFMFWGRDEILSDLIWVVRSFRPDVIITRFDTTAGMNHGHHTASAKLALEAFERAGDARSFPEQLDYLETWQPKKIFWNTSWWFTGRENFDKKGLFQIDVGQYNPMLGRSYTEISAEARTMHKSQGFGSSGSRGEEIEYLKQWEGPPSTSSLFDGIDLSWNRVQGGKPLTGMIDQIVNSFNIQDPAASIPQLIRVRQAISGIEDEFCRNKKLREVDDILYLCTGLFLETVSASQFIVEGDSLVFRVESINRSGNNIILKKIEILPLDIDTVLNFHLLTNKENRFVLTCPDIPELTITHPFWLVEKKYTGRFKYPNLLLTGKAFNDPPIIARYHVIIEGQDLEYDIPAVYKRNDPVAGEIYRSLVVVPPVAVDLERKVEVLINGQQKNVNVRVRANRENLSGMLRLDIDKAWKVIPSEYKVDLRNNGDDSVFTFTVIPPATETTGQFTARFIIDGREFARGMELIEYSHIPQLYLFSGSEAKLVHLNITTRGNLVGYLPGAGDAVPAGLEQLGYQVKILGVEDLKKELNPYDAIVLGVRAFNTVGDLSKYNKNLFEYVEQGGTLVVQYNTSGGMVTDDIAPYPISLSRSRVTDENAPVDIIEPDHPLLNVPNRITGKDFNGWIQERGLYFPGQWDQHFSAPLSTGDPGEKPLKGGLLVAQYGSGYYIYSSYSWFREIPEGVPGAFRILANMISLGN
ncbi:MAG TPA: PIG-L family deacetylase [Cyclobacteriaceae bacterium]|nr:PIG-L family deacetylase [Cyclobacteriaceae bacterium]